MYKVKFALKKYKLIYFAKKLKDFNIQVTIKIDKIKKIIIDYIKILEI